MSIRTDALKWFNAHHQSDDKVYCSKFYLPEESWPKIPVWFFQISPKAIHAGLHAHGNLLCQVAPMESEFYYLKVPVQFFKEHLNQFDQVGEKIAIYLSASGEDLFTERRGKGASDFSQFEIK